MKTTQVSKFFDALSLDTHDSHIGAAIIVATNAIMATPLTWGSFSMNERPHFVVSTIISQVNWLIV